MSGTLRVELSLLHGKTAGTFGISEASDASGGWARDTCASGGVGIPAGIVVSASGGLAYAVGSSLCVGGGGEGGGGWHASGTRRACAILGSQGSRWSCKICADPCFVVNLAIAQERQCLDSFAYVSKISQHGIVKQRDASRELKSFAPSMSKRTSCVPDGLVLLKVTADTARTSIKDECDSLCTCAVAVHLQKMLVIVCRVRRSHLRTLRHT